LLIGLFGIPSFKGSFSFILDYSYRRDLAKGSGLIVVFGFNVLEFFFERVDNLVDILGNLVS
jgi:hypothetical protein